MQGRRRDTHHMDSPTELEQSLQAAGWRARDLPGHMGRVGPLWTRKLEGGWSYGLISTDHHLNPAGVVHGGMLVTLLDHALSAIAWEAAKRQACVTISLDTCFHGAVKAGVFIEANGVIARQTRSLIFMRGTLHANGQEVVAGQAILKISGG